MLPNSESIVLEQNVTITLRDWSQFKYDHANASDDRNGQK